MIEHRSDSCTCEGKPCKRCKALRCVGDYPNSPGICRICINQRCQLNRLLLPRTEKRERQAKRGQYNIAYRAKRRARKRQSGGSYTVQEWETLKAQYDYTCLCCHRTEPEIKLVPDHVIPIAKDGSSYISNIQPLCVFCNASKCAKVIDYRPSAVFFN